MSGTATFCRPRQQLAGSAARALRARAALTSICLFAITAGPLAQAAGCTLQRLGELQVTMRGTRPLVHAQINGKDGLFLADTGASYSTLNAAVVAEFRLHVEPAPVWFAQRGVSGEAHTMITRASFSIFGMKLPRVDFFVVDNATEPALAGILGQNIFSLGDMEFDLAHNAINLLQAKDCGPNDGLAYWAAAKPMPYSVVEIAAQTRESPQIAGTAHVNGMKVRVLFDTGASHSFLTLAAARRVGITPTTAGVAAGGSFIGIGGRAGNEWIAPFASFKIGDEEIRNTHLRIGDVQLMDTDMLLGADFFLSHHVLVASSQRKLYFTYNGGPVFDLKPATGAIPPGARPD